jgi:hypothetical protein
MAPLVSSRWLLGTGVNSRSTFRPVACLRPMSRAEVAPAMASPEKNYKSCIIYCKGQIETFELQNPDHHHDIRFRNGVIPTKKRRVDSQAAKQEEESDGN